MLGTRYEYTILKFVWRRLANTFIQACQQQLSSCKLRQVKSVQSKIPENYFCWLENLSTDTDPNLLGFQLTTLDIAAFCQFNAPCTILVTVCLHH